MQVSSVSHHVSPGNQAVWNDRLSLFPNDPISTQDHNNPTAKHMHHLYTQI